MKHLIPIGKVSAIATLVVFSSLAFAQENGKSEDEYVKKNKFNDFGIMRFLLEDSLQGAKEYRKKVKEILKEIKEVKEGQPRDITSKGYLVAPKERIKRLKEARAVAKQYAPVMRKDFDAKAKEITAAVEENKKTIATNKTNIEANKTAIAKNTTNIAQNKNDIAANKAGIEHNAVAIKKVGESAQKMAAQNAALSGLFQPYSVGKFNITAAVGGYNQHAALAVGTGYRFDNNIAVKAALATDFSFKGGVFYNLGVNYEF